MPRTSLSSSRARTCCGRSRSTPTADASAAATAASGLAKFDRWATITKTSNGYYYDAGQQHTRTPSLRVEGRVRLADTYTQVLRAKPDAYRRERAAGIRR